MSSLRCESPRGKTSPKADRAEEAAEAPRCYIEASKRVKFAGKLDWWDLVEAFEQDEDQQIFVELVTDKARVLCECHKNKYIHEKQARLSINRTPFKVFPQVEGEFDEEWLVWVEAEVTFRNELLELRFVWLHLVRFRLMPRPEATHPELQVFKGVVRVRGSTSLTRLHPKRSKPKPHAQTHDVRVQAPSLQANIPLCQAEAGSRV